MHNVETPVTKFSFNLQLSIALQTNGHYAVEMFMYRAKTLLLPNYQGLHGSNSMKFEVRRSHVLYDQTIELLRQYESAIDQVRTVLFLAWQEI